MIVYCITNLLNNKKYVGLTTGSLKKRWSEHKSTKTEKQIIHKALQKYGEENFSIEVLEECSSLNDLNKSEIYWIKKLNTLKPNGYNLSNGGNSLGKHSEETKLKISLGQKGNKRKPLSEEHKKKISTASKGKILSKESRRNQSKGKDHKKKKIIDQYGFVYESIIECARTLNLERSAIRKVLSKKNTHTKGYILNYYKD